MKPVSLDLSEEICFLRHSTAILAWLHEINRLEGRAGGRNGVTSETPSLSFLPGSSCGGLKQALAMATVVVTSVTLRKSV